VYDQERLAHGAEAFKEFQAIRARQGELASPNFV